MTGGDQEGDKARSRKGVTCEWSDWGYGEGELAGDSIRYWISSVRHKG